MKFRLMYPTGFVGPHVLRELCLDVLSEGECESFVNMVFKLFGQQVRNIYCLTCRPVGGGFPLRLSTVFQKQRSIAKVRH